MRPQRSQEERLIERLRIEGPLVWDGREWFLEDDDRLRARVVARRRPGQLPLFGAEPGERGLARTA